MLGLNRIKAGTFVSGPVGTRVDRSGVYKLGWVRSIHYVSSVDRPGIEFTLVDRLILEKTGWVRLGLE